MYLLRRRTTSFMYVRTWIDVNKYTYLYDRTRTSEGFSQLLFLISALHLGRHHHEELGEVDGSTTCSWNNVIMRTYMTSQTSYFSTLAERAELWVSTKCRWWVDYNWAMRSKLHDMSFTEHSPSASTSLIMSCSTTWVGFWRSDRMTSLTVSVDLVDHIL